jgi:hypothetical protein
MCAAKDYVPLRSLPHLDGVLLWTMRAWVVGITEKIPVEEQIQDAFAKIGAPDASGQLFGFMWVLSHGARRMLNVDCVCKQHVSTDERCLLDILALSQQGRSFEALLLLRSMVSAGAATAAHDGAARVTAALTAAGRILQPRNLETARYVIAPEHAAPEHATAGAPFGRTLH